MSSSPESPEWIRALRRVPGAPPGLTFWEGAWRVAGESLGGEVRIFVCCPEGEAPTRAQAAFCAEIEAVLGLCLSRARRFLVGEIAASPEAYGLGRDEAEALLHVPDEQLPFGGPELTFYEPQTWLVRFTETRALRCAELGIGVDFEAQRPVRAHCLDEDEGVSVEP